MQLQEICHRDLKLENTLLDGSPTPRVKICDFGYSKVLYVDIELALFCILTLPVTDFSCVVESVTNFAYVLFSLPCCIPNQNRQLALQLT